ncbi:hypothetical protein H4R34_002530 [Dimargaris verticillata]|uniref:GH18 domain-containing protein n=1 Tax=Dimargaris verticillata TaxID=2761393 RepID=A0A9W8B7V2_9FUNG|nr:hypothetical protein H4R34_002530 [Dimargaris verticillata]
MQCAKKIMGGLVLVAALAMVTQGAVVDSRGHGLTVRRADIDNPSANADALTDDSASVAEQENDDAGVNLMAGGNDKVIVGYYPDWVTRFMQADQIPYDKLTHINYAFALLAEDASIKFETNWLLPNVVKKAHEKGVKLLISIGGWTGSRYFTPVLGNPGSRDRFIDNIIQFVNQYGIDGVDIDWEHPGRMGMECNIIDPQNDADNYLTFLKLLRQRMDKEYGTSGSQRKLLTMAVRVEPFDGPNGPLKDVSAFAQYVDFVNVMAYDIYGSWSKTTGPNAPFYTVGDFPYSFTQSADAWLKAKFPRNKLVMGVPFYGRSSIATNPMRDNTMMVPKEKTVPQGDQDDARWAEPCPGSEMVFSTVWQWRNLRAQGALISPEQAGPGWTRHWDQKSQTPWLYRAADKTFVSYDDPKSLNIKVNHVKHNNLRGVMAWDLHQDNGELLDVIQRVRH